MAVTLEEFVNQISFKIDERGLRQAESRIAQFGRKMEDVGKKLTVGVSLPLAALSGFSIKAAADAEETASKFGVVFGEVTDKANAMSQELIESYGLSRNESKKLLADTGDLLSGFGFTGEKALELSADVQKLAVDLASFTNVAGGSEMASQALTKALLGEREQVKQLGIAILEEDVKKKMAEQRTRGLTFETERQAKAYATLAIAQEQSKNAIGDFARTSQSLSNQMKMFNKLLENVQITFGRLLIEGLEIDKVFIGLNKTLGRFDSWLRKISPAQRRLVAVFVALGIAAGPVLLVFGNLLLLFKLLGVAMLPFLAVMGKVVLILGALFLIIDDIIAFLEGRDSVIGLWVKFWEDMGARLRQFVLGWSEFFEGIGAKLHQFTEAWSMFFEGVGAGVYQWVENAKNTIVNGFLGAFNAVKAGAQNLLGDIPLIGRFFEGVGASVHQWVENAKNTIIDGFLGAFNAVKAGAQNLLGDIPLIGRFFEGAGQAGTVPTGRNAGLGAVSSNRSVNVNSRINVGVPNGTSEEQVRAVRAAAEAGAAASFDKAITEALMTNPVSE
jgi:hypothetical protein